MIERPPPPPWALYFGMFAIVVVSVYLVHHYR